MISYDEMLAALLFAFGPPVCDYCTAPRGESGRLCRKCGRRAHRLQRYRMTLKEFDEMFAAQGRLCLGCGADRPGTSHGWEIDHDHSCCPKGSNLEYTCGRCTRGIICRRCNARDALAWMTA